uniref:Protein-tyrosine-phosphatase n=1 Tax=Panagrolaimus sp. ES5 TaxID=591445 RepID=A0AC34FEN4_9BILA
MIDKICDKLYISDAASVISERGKQKIHELAISHILTTSGMAIPESARIPNIHYKFIFMMDMLSQDFLGNNLLDDALKYIDKVLTSGGSLLVHCEVGVSRSIAIVAAYLMKKHEWNPSKAILFIQNSRPIACPNQSFIRQLAIFRQLGYKADAETLSKSSHYRNFCADTGNLPHHTRGSSSDDDNITERIKKIDLEHTSQKDIAHKRYRCRKCRTDLFYDTHILRHTIGTIDDDEIDHSEELQTPELCSYDYLIAPMKWMNIEEYQGKIFCPKCNEKLGQYIWGGRECMGDEGKPCGAHVTPWIHIQKSKVDESHMSVLAARLAAIGSHMPPTTTPPTIRHPSESEQAVN